MRSWIIGVLVGVLGLGGVAVWLVTSGQDTDAPAGAPSARNDGETQELPGFERPAAETRLADEPTPLDPASGGPGDLRAAPAAAADSNESLPEGEDVRFTGRVVDGERRPIEGATVSFVAEPMRLAMQVREDRDAVQALPSTRTGRDGRFELPARVPFGDDTREGIRFELDSQQLVVRHEAFATLSQSLAQVTGPTHDVGELTLDPGAWLSGRAVDSDGRPVAGAEARASNTGERTDAPGLMLPFFGRNLVETLEAATTGADGRFTVRGLRAGQAALDVTKTGLRASSRPELELTERSGLDVGDVTLEKGASIAGLVLDGEGRPLAGAEMSVSSMSRMVLNRLEDLPRQQLRQELGQRTRTDESGRFELSGLAGGTYTVHANADGFEPLSQADVPAGTRDLRLSPVPQGGLLVRLTSTDGGAPIDGAALDATPRQAERFGFGMRAREAQKQPLTGAEALAAAGKTGDPAGVYFVPHAGIEGTDLVVSAEGFATTALEAPGAPSGGVAEFAAQIAPESVVAGTVADPEGRPIARARLTLRSTADDDGADFSSSGDRHSREMRRSIRIGDDERTSATRHSAVTGVDGRFELHGVAAGEWELGTRAKGFVRSEPQSLTLEDGRSQPDLQVVLQPAGWIAGTVTEPGGAPVAGASISVEPTGATAADSGGDLMERQMARLESMVAGSPEARRARTDPRGAYRVGDLAPGEYTVRLDEGPRGGMFGGGAVMFAMDGAPQAGDPGQYAKVEAGQETRVDFQRPERARLTGRVLAGGTPAPNVTVRLGQADRPAFMGGGRTATTDSRGHYEFDDVTAGRYEVSAVVPGAALEKKVPVELEAGQALSADLVFGGSTLSGRVLEVETDRPAAGVNITVVPVVEDSGGGPQFAFEMVMVGGNGSSGSSVTIGGGPEKLVRTDEQGRFEVRYLEAGQYRVEAGGEGFVRANPETLEVKDGENRDDLVLRVQRGAVLSGVVVDSATGQKLDKVPVRLESDGAMEMTVTANGVYRFEGLQPGSYTVSVMGSGFFSAPLASEQVTLETGQEATLDLKTKASS
jgi:protocatechuate 3,4-dioxygenase beta subunit